MRARLRYGLVLVAVLGLLVGAGVLFAVDAESTEPEPAAFERTVTTGLTLEAQQRLPPDVTLPKAQTFYSQYEYVVGYYGVETFAEDRREAGHEQRFGYPLAVYVTDFGHVDVELTDEGYPTTTLPPPWVEAEDAWYVVGSEARSPAGETVVPFADRDAATAFVDEYGGEIASWDEMLATDYDRDDAAVVREGIDERHQAADETVAAAQAHDERPVSVVVGDADAVDELEVAVDDVTVADTVQEGIDEAPANTTVLVTEGTYDETLAIDHSITLAGDGQPLIRGDENGSVVTITEPEVGVRGLEITGVGPLTTGAEGVPGDDPEEDDSFQVYYTGADAGISAHVADGVSIADVTVETPSNGIIVRESPGVVVQNVTVQGNERWQDGFAGVQLFRSPGVLEDSTLLDGRDAVYLYRSEGVVVRDTHIENSLLGIHVMHNDDILVADNTLTDVVNTALYVMTGPEGNAFVGNHVTNAELGAYLGGSDSYVAGNVFADNDVGAQLEATGSIFEHNVFAGNELGADARAMLPTNRVMANDFVANDVHADAGTGPLRIWTDGGAGNYWQGATTVADGDPPTRPYAPTDPVDRELHTTAGAATLARAPAVDALSGLQDSVPGMRTGSVVDLSPTCEPNNPDLLDRTDWADEAWHCDGTHTIDP